MIYTFYSFKGGVGRSMALANVAELLVRRGLHVLMVDMDLEAPGLERFFDGKDYLVTPEEVQERRGIVDLLHSYKELRSLPRIGEPPPAEPGQPPFPVEPLKEFIVPLTLPRSGSLQLLPSGRRASGAYATYAERVQRFDWNEFYLRWDGEVFFDWFRNEALSSVDVVLIDSRTGVTELSGVCTFHLADAVVMCVAPNRQNLDGCVLIAESLRAPGLVSEGRRGRPLDVVAVPCRIDNSESELLDEFARQFATRLEPHVTRGLTFENSLFIDLKIPYVPAYAFRESLSVLEPDRAVAADMSAAYGRLAATLVALAPSTSRISRQFHQADSGLSREGAATVEGFVPRDWALDQVAGWLATTADPVLLVTGEPGSGKTTLARWIADEARTGERLDARLAYFHSCGPDDLGSLDARQFVQRLAGALGAADPTYAQAIRYQQGPDIRVVASEQISATSTGDVRVVDIAIGDIPAEVAFHELIWKPLQLVHLQQPLLIVVDGLESATGLTGDKSLLDLLARVEVRPIGPGIRWLITSRPDLRVLRALPGRRIDLSAEPFASADLHHYVERRAGALSAGDLIDDIVHRSGGNFLYARLLLDGVAEGHLITDTPSDLIAFYRRELTGLFGSTHDDTALIGVLTVARAPLRPKELAAIVRKPISRIDATLERWAQFLVVDSKRGVQFFHDSFREFLLDDPSFGIYADESHEAIIDYLLEDAETAWSSSRTPYAVAHLLQHLFAVIAITPDREVRETRARNVTEVLSDPDFLLAKVTHVGPASIVDDVVAGVAACAELSRVDGVADRLRGDLSDLEADLLDSVAEGSFEAITARLSRHGARIYGDAYEELRATEPPSGPRTARMNALVGELRQLARHGLGEGLDIAQMLRGGQGEAIVALAVLRVRADPGQIEGVSWIIARSRTAFEQYQALDVASQLLPLLSATERAVLRDALEGELRDVRQLGAMKDRSRGPRILDLISRLLEREEDVRSGDRSPRTR
ncbi:KGGVGR-motif variant AAA ATPase [Solirubrobacter soli]|uniref:KGGVGR-motif variant AAA ATPase n=1 Tax=Solirubrobacter soli TaxID=363832 RepID=UPI0004064F5C|nr:AAA family ATPase [Solirubrobacter soli]